VIDRLFEPLRLGPVELSNRIVSTAHQTTLVEANLPTDDFVAYHEARARGGTGLIVLEATAPHPAGLLTAHELGGYLPEIVPGYRRVAAAVQPHGTRLFVQLLDGGREQISGPPRAPALAPSPVPSQRFRVAPRALRADEIEEIVDGFATSAALAAEAGLDGVEISGAHGYLVAQFFDPELNLRDDEWGEPKRFLLEVVRAVRASAPGLALGVRLSADAAPARAVAPLLDGEVDYLSLALGESASYLGSTLIVPPPPLEDTLIERHLAPFRFGPPLIATSRVFDPLEAARLVGSGAADAVGMTRALIVDPDMPAKARAGRLDEITRCIGCQACIAHYHAGEAIRCAINPRTGRERTWQPAGAAAARRRLVVVGAGPAGLAAAAEAVAAGHEVVVLERSEWVGGQQALAASSPGGGAIASGLLANFRRTLAAVDLRLGAEATLEGVAALEPDAVVVATGARPYDPPLPLEGMQVAQAWDALAEPGGFAGSIVVADWGGDPAGVNAAETLAAEGARVTLCVAAVAFGESVHQYRRNLYLQRLYRAGVDIRMHLELAGAVDGAAVFGNAFAPELETVLEADWLLLALGRVPERSLASALAESGPRVEEAGDCLSPRSFEEAVLEGTLAARHVFA
jgi:2,4-dienoyl-CoA reductase-like NADH-dependent reductase (Old Yellow Enzyme family)/thioredoxin reductase